MLYSKLLPFEYEVLGVAEFYYLSQGSMALRDGRWAVPSVFHAPGLSSRLQVVHIAKEAPAIGLAPDSLSRGIILAAPSHPNVLQGETW